MTDPRILECAGAAYDEMQRTQHEAALPMYEELDDYDKAWWGRIARACILKWLEQAASIEMAAILAQHAAAGDTSARAALSRYTAMCEQAKREIEGKIV